MPDTNKDNQQNEINHATDNDMSAYNSDPEYISKIINHYILDNDETKPVQQSKPSNRKYQYNRQHVIDALTKMQLTFRATYASGQSTHINTDEFKSCLLKNIALQDNASIPKTMNQIDSRIINFIEMIFGAFLRDENTSDAVKNLLLLNSDEGSRSAETGRP